MTVPAQSLPDHPDDSTLDWLVAEYHRLGMFDQAAEIAERIAALRPLDPLAHLHAGVYHLVYKGDRARARADFITALRLRPGYREAQAFLHLMDEQEAPAPGPLPSANSRREQEFSWNRM